MSDSLWPLSSNCPMFDFTALPTLQPTSSSKPNNDPTTIRKAYSKVVKTLALPAVPFEYLSGSSDMPVWCSWSFISCDPQTNAVVAFDTTGGSYDSWTHVTTIPSEFGSLNSLQRLSLNSLGLSSTIPASIFSSLKQLTYLNMASNQLTGTIPSSINVVFVPQKGALQLDLSSNYLTGTIPSAFTTLQYMSLGSNKVQWSTHWNCFLTSPVPSVRNALKTFPRTSQGHCLTPHSPGSSHYITSIILLSCF